MRAADLMPGVEVTPEGYRRVWMRIASPKLYEYPEYGFTAEVTAATITDLESLRTLIGKPVTLDHPSEDVGPGNMTQFRHGVVLGVEVLGDEPFALVQLDTPEGIALGERRGWRLTCSPGYEYKPVPATDPAADFAQERGTYNHLAVLDQQSPRGGSRCRSILTAHDGVDAMLDKEKVLAALAAAGVSEDKLPALLEAIMGMEVEEAMADEAAKPEPAMDAATKAKLAAAEKRVKDAEALVRAAEKRAADAETAAMLPGIKRAADAHKVGEGADTVKTAEAVCAKVGTPYKGRDALLFVAGLGHVTAKASDGSGDGGFKRPHVVKDGASSTSDIWEA